MSGSGVPPCGLPTPLSEAEMVAVVGGSREGEKSDRDYCNCQELVHLIFAR
jgi:hypothetical protein